MGGCTYDRVSVPAILLMQRWPWALALFHTVRYFVTRYAVVFAGSCPCFCLSARSLPLADLLRQGQAEYAGTALESWSCHTHTHTHTHTAIDTCPPPPLTPPPNPIHPSTHINIHTRTRPCPRINTHARARAHTHTHTHTHACSATETQATQSAKATAYIH